MPRPTQSPEAARASTVGVSFLGVWTDAFESMCRLYEEVYGLPSLHRSAGVAWFALADRAELHVYDVTDEYHAFFGSAPVPGLLVDDYDTVVNRLEASGVEWLTEPDTAQGRIWRHYRAPDGNVYEVMGPERSDRPGRGRSGPDPAKT
jgi:hypothetical protein